VPYAYGYGEAPYDVYSGDVYAAVPEDENCYYVRRRVLTDWGPRYRRVLICE
jgi:hypothetical protein